MKTKTSKLSKQSKRAIQVKDIPPKKDAKGGGKISMSGLSFVHPVDKSTP